MLTMEGSRARQARLRAMMEWNRWDVFLTCNYRTVYYLTGSLCPQDGAVILAIRLDGGSVLVTPTRGEAAVDEIIRQENYSIQRSITRPWRIAAGLLQDYISGRENWKVTRAGIDFSGVPLIIAPVFGTAVQEDATDAILHLRKRKDPDEIEEIRTSLRYCATGYRAAKETIEAGVTELDVYNAMTRAVFDQAGTTIAFAGDFACGVRAIQEGGAPTNRVVKEGDLYVLDLFPAPALYFGDTCRTFSVDEPSDLQHRAWEIVMSAMRRAEGMIKPGVLARDVYREVKQFLDSYEITENSFWHHLGHGIGHHGHEAPRMIPGSDDLFEVGDVITIEPGVYTEALQGGVRLENDYVVGETGLERLFDFPMELM